MNVFTDSSIFLRKLCLQIKCTKLKNSNHHSPPDLVPDAAGVLVLVAEPGHGVGAGGPLVQPPRPHPRQVQQHHPRVEALVARASIGGSRRFHNHGRGPRYVRAFSKVEGAFTFKTVC